MVQHGPLTFQLGHHPCLRKAEDAECAARACHSLKQAPRGEPQVTGAESSVLRLLSCVLAGLPAAYSILHHQARGSSPHACAQHGRQVTQAF